MGEKIIYVLKLYRISREYVITLCSLSTLPIIEATKLTMSYIVLYA